MTIRANWVGAFVEDADENRAYVTEEDTRKLAEYYKIISKNDKWYRLAAILLTLASWLVTITVIVF